MKKIIYVLMLSLLMFSCSNNNDKNKEINNTGSIQEQKEDEQKLSEEEMIELEIQKEEEMIELEMQKEDALFELDMLLEEVDEYLQDGPVYDDFCNEFFDLGDERNQLVEQKTFDEYINKCEEKAKNAKNRINQELLNSIENNEYQIKDDFSVEYKEFMETIEGLEYENFKAQIERIGIEKTITKQEYENGISITYDDYKQSIINNIKKSNQELKESLQ